MFSALRTARVGRTALWIAGCLAIMGSFGLHPEPVRAPNTLLPGTQPSWTVSQRLDQASHDCLACLAHRSVTLARLSGVVLQPGSSVSAALPANEVLPRRLWRPQHEGRAPPAPA